MSKLKNLIKRAAAGLGYQISRIPEPKPPQKPNPIHLWRDEAEFAGRMARVAGHTLVDEVRCFIIYQHALQARSLEGDAAEVGVYRGGTARLLAETLMEAPKTLHLFDTFTGMPPTDPEKDLHREGDFRDTSLESVREYLSDCPNVRFYKGLFPETGEAVAKERFCLVHVDVDIYRSVMDCCRFFHPRLVAGGVMIFDDYGFLSCPGAKTAVDEFFSDKPERPCYLPTGQCVVTRLASTP